MGHANIGKYSDMTKSGLFFLLLWLCEIQNFVISLLIMIGILIAITFYYFTSRMPFSKGREQLNASEGANAVEFLRRPLYCISNGRMVSGVVHIVEEYPANGECRCVLPAKS